MGRWKWPLLAGGAWLGLSLGMAIAGLWMRFLRPYYLEEQLGMQVMMVGECVLALLALMYALPMTMWVAGTSTGPKVALAVIVAPVLAALLLQVMAFESPEENQAKNVAYLSRHAGVILAYEKTRGRMPASFDIALEKSKETFPHRGDADGHEVSFRRIDRHRYLICAPSARMHLKLEAGRMEVDLWPRGSGDPCYAKGG